MRYRWWIILASVSVVIAAGLGIRRIRISNDTRVFFGEHNPDYRMLKAFEDTYSREQGMLFMLAPRDGNVFTRQTLSVVCELTEAGWQVPHSSSVGSIANFPCTRVSGDDLIGEDLVTDPDGLSDEDLARIRRIALAEPALVNSAISPSGHVAGVYVSLVVPHDDPGGVPEVAAYARAMAEDFHNRYPSIDIYITGSVIIDQAFAQASRQDLYTLFPVAFLVMTSLVGISLGSFYGTFAAVITTVLSMIAAMGLTGWLGIPLNAVSVGAPGLILTLAVADNVHILTTTFHRMRQGCSRHEAIAQSIQVNLKAIFLTSITTIVGFLSMNFSESPPFRDLGNIVGLGVTIDLLNSILLLPALMAVLPASVRPRRERILWMNPDRLADFVIARRRVLLWLMTVVVVLAGVGMSRIELDDNFLTYFDESFEFRRATDFLTKNLGGWDVIEYSLDSGESAGIFDPEYMAAVDRFAQWYRAQPDVVRVSTFVDTMKRLNRDMHGGDEAYYRIPDQRELAAQYLLFYEMSLPVGRDLNSQIDVDRSATRFSAVLRSMSAKELCRMDEAACEWLQANVPQHMVTHGTSLSLIWARITARNIRSMLLASLGEILLISCLMIVAIRNLRFVVIFLIPNLVPPLIAFGIWGVTKGRVGLALSVVIAMTLGIIVDDTIHFFVTYFRARRDEGMSPEMAVRHALETVGAAIGITTLVLVCGFLVMTLSHYKMSSEMGLMCAMVIGLALVVDILLSPTLLMTFDRTTDKLAADKTKSSRNGGPA